ncbi:MAG: tRNA pseudouridine(38-40) synthase TruA, partial [Desulfonatronovibrionaceae bacterium]
MPRFALHLAYIGTAYHGWQRQKDKSTVQETVEKALYTICQEQITVHASGRTDAGVHALDQVIHCDLPVDKQGISWTRALNAILPPDICVTRHAEVPPEFHARKSAVSKEYSYTFWTEPEYVLPHKRPYVWETGPLDLMQMQQALAGLRGRHDFAALMNTGTPVDSTVRTVSRAELKCGNGPEIVFTVRANG